jgi:hypothetical protein
MLEKADNGGFLVKNKQTGRILEKEGIPKERALAQIKAVYSHEKQEKPYPLNKIRTFK